MRAIAILIVLIDLASPIRAQEPEVILGGSEPEMGSLPEVEATVPATAEAAEVMEAFDLDPVELPDRVSFRVDRSQRGTTLTVPTEHLVRLCSDIDGCKVRLGMFNWDNTGRVASRETLLFFNRVNRAWRGSAGDLAGTDYDGTTSHVLQAWACYFTDGAYTAFRNQGDSTVGFGLLSWNQYVADCFLTIID